MFIEHKSSVMTPSKSNFTDNRETAPEEPSNTDASICEHEQALSEDECLNVTKEALTFK
jgi:hypothetical protein